MILKSLFKKKNPTTKQSVFYFLAAFLLPFSTGLLTVALDELSWRRWFLELLESACWLFSPLPQCLFAPRECYRTHRMRKTTDGPQGSIVPGGLGTQGTVLPVSGWCPGV